MTQLNLTSHTGELWINQWKCHWQNLLSFNFPFTKCVLAIIYSHKNIFKNFSNVTNENICGNISNIKILHMLIDELLIKRFVMINKFIFCVHLYSDFYSVIISRQKYVLNAFKSLFDKVWITELTLIHKNIKVSS
jgi:hypothetical protein